MNPIEPTYHQSAPFQIHIGIQGNIKTYLGHSKRLTPPKERTLFLLRTKQRFNLPHDSSDHLLSGGIALRLRRRTETGEEVGDDFAEECVDEEGDTGAV